MQNKNYKMSIRVIKIVWSIDFFYHHLLCGLLKYKTLVVYQ